MLAYTDQITKVSSQSSYGKNCVASLIIQRHRPTYKTAGQQFHGYERKKVRHNFRRN